VSCSYVAIPSSASTTRTQRRLPSHSTRTVGLLPVIYAQLMSWVASRSLIVSRICSSFHKESTFRQSVLKISTLPILVSCKLGLFMETLTKVLLLASLVSSQSHLLPLPVVCLRKTLTLGRIPRHWRRLVLIQQCERRDLPTWCTRHGVS